MNEDSRRVVSTGTSTSLSVNTKLVLDSLGVTNASLQGNTGFTDISRLCLNIFLYRAAVNKLQDSVFHKIFLGIQTVQNLNYIPRPSGTPFKRGIYF